jgi:hypothetical protein
VDDESGGPKKNTERTANAASGGRFPGATFSHDKIHAIVLRDLNLPHFNGLQGINIDYQLIQLIKGTTARHTAERNLKRTAKMTNEAIAVVQSNFNLKNVPIELIHTGCRSVQTFKTIEALEAMRTERPAVPASKHGLETICGASCEVGAV